MDSNRQVIIMKKTWDKLFSKKKQNTASSTSGSGAYKIFVLLELEDRLSLYSLSLDMTPHGRDSVKAKRLPKPVTISLEGNRLPAGMTITRWGQPPGWRLLVFGGEERQRCPVYDAVPCEDNDPCQMAHSPKMSDEAMLIDIDSGIVKEEIPRMHSGKRSSIAVPVYGGKICVFERVLKSEQGSNFEVFDPTQTPFLWSKLDDLPQPPNSRPPHYPGIMVEAWFVHNHNHMLYVSTSLGIYRVDFSREEREWNWEHLPKFRGVTRFPFQGAGLCVGNLCFTMDGAFDVTAELGFTYRLSYPPQMAFCPLVQFQTFEAFVHLSGGEDRGPITLAIVRTGYKHGGVGRLPSRPHLTVEIIEVGQEQPVPHPSQLNS